MTKNILITGGSMGIGLEVAKECARSGHNVTVVSRHEKDLKIAVSELEKISAGKHRYFVADVSSEKNVQNLSKEISQLDGLVNAAAILRPIGLSEIISINDFSKTIQINLIGTFTMCHYFLPKLVKSGGKIVNFSGGGATAPFPRYSAYAASKAAVVRLTENLATEYAGKIHVNAIAPGFVLTRLHKDTLEAGDEAGIDYLKKTEEALKKDSGTPPRLAAKLAGFLLSAKSDGITGKLLSAEWDPWQEKRFQNKLKQDIDFCTLRRIDGQFYFKKSL